MTRSLTILLALLLFACDGTREAALPPLPVVELSTFEPAVRRQLEDALREARGQLRGGEASRRLGMLLHAYGWLPQAAVCYRRAALLDSGDILSRYYLARIQVESGETRAARATLEDAVEDRRGNRSDDASVLILLGELAFGEGDLDAARRWYERALELSPSSPRALLGVGRVRFETGDTGGAVEVYRKALQVAPGLTEAAYRLALVHRARGELEKARRYFEAHAAGEGGAPHPDPHLEKLESLRVDAEHVYRQANALAKSGNNDEAIGLYEKVLKLNPDLTAASYNIALALLRMERSRDAIPYLEGFLARRPEHVDAHNNLGLCFLQLGRDEAAVRSFESALAIEPGYHKAHVNLGIVRWRQGRSNEAKEHLRAALGILPAYPEAHLHLALLFEEEGDRDAALTHLLAALDVAPDHELAHRTLLRLFGLSGRAEDPARERGIASRRAASFLYGKRRHAAAIHALRGTVDDAGEWRSAVTLAWILATCPEEKLRRPVEAVRLMEPICREQASADPTALDTLAAAYAAAGRFDDARRTAASALKLASEAGTAGESLRQRIAFRLRLYEGNRAFHEE